MIIGAVGPGHKDVTYSGDETSIPGACVQDYKSGSLPRDIATALCAGGGQCGQWSGAGLTCPPALVCMVLVDPRLV